MTEEKLKTCGIVMPISESDGRSASHWSDVLKILEDAAEQAGFKARLVSDTLESNLIHKEILQNIYNDDIIICDVSGRNPNVFFELGIRMATQLPTVIVKDDDTIYPFDTGPNRYIGYPKDLRHPLMEKFKSELVDSLKKTIDHSKEQSFIGQLGPFQIPDVESTTLPASDIIISRLDRMETALNQQRNVIAHGIIPNRNALANSLQQGLNAERKRVHFVEAGLEEVIAEVSGFSNTEVDNGVDDFMQSAAGKGKSTTIDHLSRAISRVSIEGKDVHSPKLQRDFRRAIENAIPF
ncbi:MAG: hypothetical protein QNI90_05905 [Dinoroseobacter sp.]|nr:hypothetical protein [Dinoroseobacter sp.]